jgi:hypothetical protein
MSMEDFNYYIGHFVVILSLVVLAGFGWVFKKNKKQK